MFDEHLTLFTHAPVCSKHEWCENSIFYIDYPLEVFPLFARLVAFKYGGGGFPGLAREVDVRDSYIKKCSYIKVCLLCQNPPALMSSLASVLLFVVLFVSTSFVIGSRWGSASTSLQTLLRRFVKRSLKQSCLCATKPPFLQLRACSTLKGLPHGAVRWKVSEVLIVSEAKTQQPQQYKSRLLI